MTHSQTWNSSKLVALILSFLFFMPMQWFHLVIHFVQENVAALAGSTLPLTVDEGVTNQVACPCQKPRFHDRIIE